MAGVELGFSTAQDIRSNKTREIMAKRFDYAKKIGCDGVDPDNTGAHEVEPLPCSITLPGHGAQGAQACTCVSAASRQTRSCAAVPHHRHLVSVCSPASSAQPIILCMTPCTGAHRLPAHQGGRHRVQQVGGEGRPRPRHDCRVRSGCQALQRASGPFGTLAVPLKLACSCVPSVVPH